MFTDLHEDGFSALMRSQQTSKGDESGTVRASGINRGHPRPDWLPNTQRNEVSEKAKRAQKRARLGP